MKFKHFLKIAIGLIFAFFIGQWAFKNFNFNYNYKVGQILDSLNGVKVYYNGGVLNTCGRNLTADNYNLGMKYQCVEFVKRYYYEHLHHKMPDSYGNAKDFFDSKIKDGDKNRKRDLIQYTNSSITKPKVSDLIVFSPSFFNKFGHVAIISKVSDNQIEIIQQNPGPYGKSRVKLTLQEKDKLWRINDPKTLGWLRKEK